MARREIPVYSVNRVAYAPDGTVQGDVDNGMFFGANGGFTWLEIENPGTLAIVVGAAVNDNAVDDITIPNKEITVEAGSEVKFGPFPKTYYSQDDLSVNIDIDGTTYVAYPEAGTALTFRAFDLG